MPVDPSEEVSELLSACSSGDRAALDRLIPIVYDELRRRARQRLRGERRDHTLRTTALVNEAYVRLAGQRFTNCENRAHFFGLASEIMRRILVDHARGRNREKRGGDAEIVQMESHFQIAVENSTVNLLELDAALDDLAALDPQQAKVVELRFFGGCSIEETSDILGVAPMTVKRDWATAKAWLKHKLEPLS